MLPFLFVLDDPAVTSATGKTLTTLIGKPGPSLNEEYRRCIVLACQMFAGYSGMTDKHV